MIARFHPVLCLVLFFASCDKRENAPDPPERTVSAPRVTKSDRPAPDELPNPHETLRSAISKAGEIPTPEERNRALSAAVWDALETDPELAREGFRQMTAGSEERNRLLGHFAMRLAEEDAEDAIRWADSLETDEEKSQALGKIALTLSEKEPERAARLLSDSGIAGRDFDVAVVQVVQRWAGTAPAAAAGWVVLFDAGEARSAGLAEVVSIWIGEDPKAAFAWIPSIEDKTLREEAELGAARSILNEAESDQGALLKHATPAIRARFGRLRTEEEEENR
ncbi:MAG: hypothetical protein V4584_05710 [Verrucomicrobiota bacterium]